MLIHLFFIGQIAFFVVLTGSHPSRGHRRRQADSPTHMELKRNVMPVIPSDYDLPALQLIQNKKILHPPNLDSQGNLIYFPSNSKARGYGGILANLKGVKGIPDLINKERKKLLRDQRKQPTPEDLEPCGHFQTNDYNMLTNIIAKMSSEARNALIDALLKTLMDKSKVSAVKSNDNMFSQHSLDAALQPPLRLNTKPEGHLVQPFSLNVEREKLRDLYKYLNNENFRNGLKKTNVIVNLGELLQETIKKDEKFGSTKTPHCCQKHSTTKSEALPSPEQTQKNSPVIPERSIAEFTGTTPTTQEAENSEDCNYGDQCGDTVTSSVMDFPSDKVINLTQIFNVHPKLLIVNAGQLAPTDIARLLTDKGNPECQTTTAATSQAGTTPMQPTIVQNPRPNHLMPPTRSSNNHRKCTRRHNGRPGCRHRYDRRGHVCPIQDLAYTYYADMDDLPLEGD